MEAVAPGVQTLQLVAVNEIGPGARRVEQCDWNGAPACCTMWEHASERHDAETAADEEHRTAIVHRPHEVSSDGTAQLDLVTHRHSVMEERRHLAVIELLDSELDML